MQYDAGGLYHVHVQRRPPERSSELPWWEKATGDNPVDWQTACAWLQYIMTSIGLLENGRHMDCVIVPAAKTLGQHLSLEDEIQRQVRLQSEYLRGEMGVRI